MTVYRWNQEEFDTNYYPHGALDCFAKDTDGFYYFILRASDARSPASEEMVAEIEGATEVETHYMEAFDAIRAYAEQQVLATEGVEPFTPDLLFYMPNYVLDGLDYNMVTSYEDVPEDPEQWYLVGQLPGEPVWMFTRDRGAETTFQIGDRLTQEFPYRACFYGGGFTPDGKVPQLMRLWGSGEGKGTYDGAFAVITHLFQGGVEAIYQLTVYDLDADPVVAYVHDWEPLMEDFNENRATYIDAERRVIGVSYEGQTAEIAFDEDDAQWPAILEYGYYDPESYETSMSYIFDYIDGYFEVIMPIWGPPVYSACWTVRFTGSGFETIGFRFIETSGTDIW